MKFDLFTYLNLHESIKEFEFVITIDDIEYKVIRDWHLTQKRTGDNKPKDYNMSKAKYTRIFEQALKSNMDLSKPFSITWSSNNKNNIISAVMKKGIFEVFGAIMNSKIDAQKLYKVALQRLHLNKI